MAHFLSVASNPPNLGGIVATYKQTAQLSGGLLMRALMEQSIRAADFAFSIAVLAALTANGRQFAVALNVGRQWHLADFFEFGKNELSAGYIVECVE